MISKAMTKANNPKLRNFLEIFKGRIGRLRIRRGGMLTSLNTLTKIVAIVSTEGILSLAFSTCHLKSKLLTLLPEESQDECFLWSCKVLKLLPRFAGAIFSNLNVQAKNELCCVIMLVIRKTLQCSGKGLRWGARGGRDKITICTVKAHEAWQPTFISSQKSLELCRWLSKHIFPKRRAFPVLAASEFRGVKQTTDR